MLAYGSSFSFRTISVPAVAVYASGAPATVAVCWVTEEIGVGGSTFSSFFSPSFLSPSFASGSSATATPAAITAASASASPVVIRFTQSSPRSPRNVPACYQTTCVGRSRPRSAGDSPGKWCTMEYGSAQTAAASPDDALGTLGRYGPRVGDIRRALRSGRVFLRARHGLSRRRRSADPLAVAAPRLQAGAGAAGLSQPARPGQVDPRKRLSGSEGRLLRRRRRLERGARFELQGPGRRRLERCLRRALPAGVEEPEVPSLPGG